MHDDQVVIERRERGSVRRFKFNRQWAQLIISELRGIERGRLALRSHGKEVGFGMFLPDELLAATALRIEKHLNVRHN